MNIVNNHLKHFSFNLLNFKLLNSNNYISSFYNINIDSLLVSFILYLLIFFVFKFFLLKVKYYKLPNKFIIFLELILLFVLNNVKKINGKKDKYIFSLSFLVFNLIFLMNLMGLIPINIINYLFKRLFNIDNFKFVPSSDINITLSISFCVLLYIFIYKIFKKGFLNILKDVLFHPFNNKFFIFFNILLEIINIFSKLLSLSLRLFGNIYSGEIIFIILLFFTP